MADYSPNSILNLLHSVRSDNEFKLPASLDNLSGSDFGGLNDFLESDAGEYYSAVFRCSVAMILVWFIWMVLLILQFNRCTSCCGSCANGSLRRYFFFFSYGGLVSCIVSLFGISRLNTGMNTVVDRGADVSKDLTATIDNLTGILGLETDFSASGLSCNLDGAEDDFNTTTSSLFASMQEPTSKAEDIDEFIASTVDTIEDNFQKILVAYLVVLCFVILSVILQTLSASLIVVNSRRESNDHCCGSLRFLQRGFCVTVLVILSLLIVATVWIVAAILSAVAFVGSDMCVDNPSLNLQATLAEYVVEQGKASNTSELDFCTLDFVEDLTTDEETGNLICFYSECRGDSFLLTDLNVASELSSLKTLLNDAAAAENNAACTSSVDSLASTIDEIQNEIDEISSTLGCANLQDTYIESVNNGLCNGVFSGVSFIFVTLLFGGIGLMISMCFFVRLDPPLSEEEARVQQIRDRRSFSKPMSRKQKKKEFKAMQQIERHSARYSKGHSQEFFDPPPAPAPPTNIRGSFDEITDSREHVYKKMPSFNNTRGSFDSTQGIDF